MEKAGARGKAGCGCERPPSSAADEAPEGGGGGGGGCGERCGQPGPAPAEATDAAYRSVSQALEHLQEVIGHLDAKVEGTRRAIHGIKHSIRDKRRRVDGLQKRMDDVERKLLFDDKLKEFFRPFADCVVPAPPAFPLLPVPPPVYSSISTSTSDLASSGSETMAFDSSLSCLRSFSLAPDSAHSPVSIAISVPNSPTAALNGDLQDSTVILRIIPVSNSTSTHSVASDTTHQDNPLPVTNSHLITACLTENSSTHDSRTCCEGIFRDKSPSTPKISSVYTNESLCRSFDSAHKTRSVLSPISARETNSNYTTSTVPDSKSVHVSMPTFRRNSVLKLFSGSHVQPNDESASASKLTHSPIFTPEKDSMKKRESIHKFNSSSLTQVDVSPLFISTPNPNTSTSNRNFPLDSKITPTFIPTCASESSCPPVPIPSCISCSSPVSPSPFASIVNYSSSFLSGMERPSGWSSLLIQTVSSTVRPLTVHSSRVMSDEDERDDRAPPVPRCSTAPAPFASELPPLPTTSGDETDSMCAIEYIALPHFQRSAFAQTDPFRAPSGAPAAVASLPSVFRHEAHAPGLTVARTSRSTTIQSELAFAQRVTSVGVCTSKAVASVQAASVAVATSVSCAAVPHAPLPRPEYHLLTGKTLTLLGKELLKASYEGRAADVELILRAGVHVDYTCGSTWTPLHRASWGGHEGVVALLLRRGADVRAATAFGFTALHIAAYNDPRGECVRLLIDAGAELDARNRLGWTPLHYAAEGGRSSAVGALVKAGANAMVRSARGKTPFHVARSLKIRQLLLTGHDDTLIQEEDEQEMEVS